LSGGAPEVVDVSGGAPRRGGPPGGQGLSVEELARLQAALQHPLRFVLQRGDVAHDLFAQTTPGGGPGSVVVMPSIAVVAHGVDDLVLGELFWCARHGVLPSVSGM